MSSNEQRTPDEPADDQQSISNPFAERPAGDAEERPPLNISKRRAAAMGTAFGLSMALLALVCIAVSFALSSCTA